jgi:4-hydroxy-tetrahydrodipicolinate reductase
MIKLIITGSKGRMGQALLACAASNPALQVVAQIGSGDDLAAVIERADVVIDFSSHKATPGVAALCAAHKKAVVIGTTGHSEADKAQITSHRSQIPMVLAKNRKRLEQGLFGLNCLDLTRDFEGRKHQFRG